MTSSRVSYIKRLALALVLSFVCLGLGVLLNVPFDKQGNMFYAPAFSALFLGPIYYVLLLREKSFGFISLVAALLSLFFFFSGHFWASVLPYLCFGVLADSLAAWGSYEDRLKNALSFLAFAFISSGPIIFMWLMPEAYGAALLVRGKDMAYIERVMLPANPQTVSLFIVAILVGGLLGAYLGQVLLKKQQAENGTGILTSCFGLDNIKDNK